MKRLLLSALAVLVLQFLSVAQTQKELHTMSGTIYGTLLMPDASTEKVAVVLIISGSGPTDRDGNNPQMKNNSLLMLADSLKSHGIASLRYDKRGIAASKAAGLEEADLRFDNYVDDASAWVRLLRKSNEFSKIIIAGHSEGSLIGMVATGREHADAFISLAGAGRPADKLLKEQLSSQPEQVKRDCYSMIDSLVAGRTLENVSTMYYSLFRPSIQPYLISWFRFDPLKEINKLNVPVMILQGTTDIQVSTEDANLLAKAAPGSELDLIPGMNHILKNASSIREENISTYSDPELPLNGELVKKIVSFLERLK